MTRDRSRPHPAAFRDEEDGQGSGRDASEDFNRSRAGPLAITAGAGSLNASNYDFTALIDGTLMISPAHLMVTADSQNHPMMR